MEDEGAENFSEERQKDSLSQTSRPAFAAAEMIRCGECARVNPPTRATCLYCGAKLEFTAAQSEFLKPSARPIESWEKGFNLIFADDSDVFDDAQIERAAAALQLETEVLRRITASRKSLPLARVETEIEAEAVQRNLRAATRIETRIVGDETLDQANPPRRLRALEFSAERLVLTFFSGGENAEIAWSDLILIVSGAIFERRVEATEARGRRGESKIVEANETASDEILIDFYSRDDSFGFRVPQNGFDFSCLGAEKSLLVGENMRALIERLARRAPNAKVAEDYLQVRAQLAAVWAVEERTDSRGLKRDRFAKFNRENVTTINNAAQFTKYSRLLRHLL